MRGAAGYGRGVAMFQIDALVSPSGRGLGYLTSDMAKELKRNHRERILDATKEGITEAARKFASC